MNLTGADLGWSRFWQAKLYPDSKQDVKSSHKVSFKERCTAEISVSKIADTEHCISEVSLEKAGLMMTGADQTGSFQVSPLEIYLAEIRSMEICMAEIKSVERDPSIMIKLSGLSKHVKKVNGREAGAKVI